MPDPQALPGPYLAPADFAGRIRAKARRPDGTDPYAGLSDDDLIHRVVTKYPQYQKHVVDVAQGLEGIDTSAPDPRVLALQRQAQGQLEDQDRIAAAGKAIEGQIDQQLAPPGAAYGPLGMLAGLASDRLKGLTRGPEEGIPQLARGVAAAAGSSLMGAPPSPQAASDIIEGGMRAGEPGLPAAVIAAPVPTLFGLLTGIPAQYGGAKIAPALGFEGEGARLFANIAGLVGGSIGAEAAGAGRTLLQRRMLNATDQRVIDAARALPLPAKTQRISPALEARVASLSADPAAAYPGISPDLPAVQDAYPAGPYDFITRSGEAIKRTPVQGPTRRAPLPKTSPASLTETHADLVGVAEPPPGPRVAAAARAVQAVPPARPTRKLFAQTLERVKAGQVDPKDPTVPAYERMAASVYQRTGTLTIEDVERLHGRFAQVGDTLRTVATAADQVGQPPPAAGGFRPDRALPPVGTSVVGGVPQSILDPVVQARLDQSPRFIAEPPEGYSYDPNARDYLGPPPGVPQYGVPSRPVIESGPPPELDQLVQPIEDAVSQAPPPAGIPEHGRITPRQFVLRRERPGAPVAEAPALPGLGRTVRGKARRARFGQTAGPPADLFTEGVSPVGATRAGQLGIPIKPEYRAELGERVKRRNKSPRAFEAGVFQAPYDEVSQPELIEVGKMLTALEARGFARGNVIRDREGNLPSTDASADERFVQGHAGHPVYYDIVGGDPDSGPIYRGYSRADVISKLKLFLEQGKRSLISDLAVEAARRAQDELPPKEVLGLNGEYVTLEGGKRGHRAMDVPEAFGRQAARIPEGPGFEPIEIGEPPPQRQGKLQELPEEPSEDLPAWVTDPEHDLGPTQQAGGIGEPPPNPRTHEGTPGRVPSGLDRDEFLNVVKRDLFGADEGQPALPGTEQVRETENPQPTEALPFALTRDVGQPPPGKQETLFGERQAPEKPKPQRPVSGLDNPRLFDEVRQRNAKNGTGFTVTVPPPIDAATTKGFKKWLNQRRAEHFAEPWFEAAMDELTDGDPMKAYRIASMASQEVPTVGARTRTEYVGAPPPMTAAQLSKLRTKREGIKEGVGQGAGAGVAQPPPGPLKATLEGYPLPPRTTVGTGGLLVPPTMVRNLNPSFTDQALGHTFVRSTFEAVDHLADRIVLHEGGSAAQPKELRLSRQVVSGMLEDAAEGHGELKKLGKLLGLRPEEVARHFERSLSQAGKVLNAASQFYARNIDSITLLERAGFDVSGLDAKGIHGMLQTPEVRARLRAAQKVADTARALGILVEQDKGLLSRVDQVQFAHALSGDRHRAYMGLLNDIENFSRALIVSQPVTGIRNLWTQAGRYFVGAVDQALSAPFAAITGDLQTASAHLGTASEMLKAPFRPGAGVTPNRAIHDTMQAVYDFTAESLRNMPVRDVRRTLGVLDKFPQLAAEYMGAAAGDLTPGKSGATAAAGRGRVSRAVAKLASPRVRNVLTALNRSAEFSQRAVVFDAIFRAGLRAKGIDPNVLLVEDFKTIAHRLGPDALHDLTTGAMHAALDYTFASKPLAASIPGRALKLFNEIPVLSPLLRTGYPFPRFNLVAAPRFLYDHSPAALLDILRLPIDALTAANAPKGRLWRGLQAASIEAKALPKMEFAVRDAEASHGRALQDWIAARQEAAGAARRIKRIEAKAARQGTLHGLTDQYQAAIADLHEIITQRDAARVRAGAAKHEWRALVRQREQLAKTVRDAKSIGAPTFHEFIGRQATGLALLGAALALRQSDGAKGTQWYEYRVGGRTLDFRPFAPFVQYLLVADWMHDLYQQTDWTKARAQAKQSLNPVDWAEAVRANYSGKYTHETFGKQLVQAFLSMSQAAGTTLSVVDLATGESTSQGILNDVYNGVLGSMGQFLGRFTTPLQTVNDVVGQFSEEDRKARIPEEPVPGDRKERDALLGPTISHIPGLRRTIPEKVNPMTGQPIGTVDPIARQFAGLTQRERSRWEQELARVGLPWYKATPRQVGDRDFDNAVARGYAQGLQRYLPKLLANKVYQKMPVDLQRETLQGVMTDIKGYAYAQVAKQIGAKPAYETLQRPADKERGARWRSFLTSLQTELSQERPAGADDQVGVPPPGPGLGGR